MVHCGNDNRDNRDNRWIAAVPNRSASWRANRLLIVALAAWLSTVGGAFGAAGLWLVLPFAGLELGLVALVLYRVSRQLQQRHVVRLSQDHIRIEKGRQRPSQIWNFDRCAVKLSVDICNHPEDPLQLSLFTPSVRVRVGDFLNKDDSRTLLTLLRNAGIAVANQSRSGRLQL